MTAIIAILSLLFSLFLACNQEDAQKTVDDNQQTAHKDISDDASALQKAANDQSNDQTIDISSSDQTEDIAPDEISHATFAVVETAIIEPDEQRIPQPIAIQSLIRQVAIDLQGDDSIATLTTVFDTSSDYVETGLAAFGELLKLSLSFAQYAEKLGISSDNIDSFLPLFSSLSVDERCKTALVDTVSKGNEFRQQFPKLESFVFEIVDGHTSGDTPIRFNDLASIDEVISLNELDILLAKLPFTMEGANPPCSFEDLENLSDYLLEHAENFNDIPTILTTISEHIEIGTLLNAVEDQANLTPEALNSFIAILSDEQSCVAVQELIPILNGVKDLLKVDNSIPELPHCPPDTLFLLSNGPQFAAAFLEYMTVIDQASGLFKGFIPAVETPMLLTLDEASEIEMPLDFVVSFIPEVKELNNENLIATVTENGESKKIIMKFLNILGNFDRSSDQPVW